MPGIIEVTTLRELTEKLGKEPKGYLLVYKNGSETSQCALEALSAASESSGIKAVYRVDAPVHPEIHKHYGITSAPALLIFEQGELRDVVKGCHGKDFYRQLFENTSRFPKGEKGNEQKSVTVYSTPTCTWCNTLKAFFRKHGIRFTDIDVSRNRDAAERMVAATGQQGVPQTNIGGEWVVGFDQARIKRLLNINQ